MSINAELQKTSVDSTLVELFTIDCTNLGGSIYRFTPHFAEGQTISFGGLAYTSIPITSDGWDLTSSGTQPRPTVTVSNVNKVLLNAVVTLGDIVGARVTRLRTLRNFLDDGATPDSGEYLPVDIYVVEQKISHNKHAISWQLSSIIDRFGVKIPRQQITKDRFPGVGRSRGAW